MEISRAAGKKENDGTVSYQVTIPANTTATLHLLLPTLDYVVEESGKAAVKAEGVSSVTFMNGKAVLELQSGTYQFVIKKGKQIDRMKKNIFSDCTCMLCTAPHPCTKARRMQAREPSLRPPDQSAGHRQCQSQIVVDAGRCPTRSPADCLSDNSQHRLTESKQRKRGNMELGEKKNRIKSLSPIRKRIFNPLPNITGK